MEKFYNMKRREIKKPGQAVGDFWGEGGLA